MSLRLSPMTTLLPSMVPTMRERRCSCRASDSKFRLSLRVLKVGPIVVMPFTKIRLVLAIRPFFYTCTGIRKRVRGKLNLFVVPLVRVRLSRKFLG